MAADGKVSVTATWNRMAGCELEKALEVQITHEELFYKPALEEILHEERAILLTTAEGSEVCAGDVADCELQFKIFPQFKFRSVHLLCSAPKLELFVGPLKEYNETIYGTIVNSDEHEQCNQLQAMDDDCEDDCNNIQSYRYDIEITKSGVVEMAVKLLNNNKNEICIFGLLLLVAPNPNGVTTLMPNATIDLGNVNEMLNSSKQKLSPAAEKCKLFMEMYNKSQLANNNPNYNPTALLDQMKHMMAANTHSPSSETHPVTHINTAGNNNINIEEHINKKLQELEGRLNERIDQLHAIQTAKLDAILQILNDLKK